jgi:hypothetical protein
LSEVVDIRTLHEIAKKMEAITRKARFDDETGRYSIEADDWHELHELITSSLQQVPEGPGKRVGHAFTPAGKCSGCGMSQDYYEAAMAVLERWPKDSEKDERMSELRTCRNDIRS